MLAQGLPVAIAAGAALAALIWHDRLTMAQSSIASYGYVDQILDPHICLAAQLAEGLRLRISETGRLMAPGMWKAYGAQGHWLNVNVPIYAAITVFVAAGWWRLVRHRRDVFLLAVPFYAAIYIVWPYDQGTRFFTPMLPIMWAAVAAMLLLPWRRRASGRGKEISRPGASCRRRAGIVLVALLAAHTIIWPIYWASWLQSAGRSQELWPVASELAAAVGAKGGAGVFVDDTGPLRLLLCVATDRDWPAIPAGQSVPPDARWVVAPEKNASVEGFAPVRQSDGFVLLERK
jgi:hypothetical protein